MRIFPVSFFKASASSASATDIAFIKHTLAHLTKQGMLIMSMIDDLNAAVAANGAAIADASAAIDKLRSEVGGIDPAMVQVAIDKLKADTATLTAAVTPPAAPVVLGS